MSPLNFFHQSKNDKICKCTTIFAPQSQIDRVQERNKVILGAQRLKITNNQI